jgi:hypothetical protein
MCLTAGSRPHCCIKANDRCWVLFLEPLVHLDMLSLSLHRQESRTARAPTDWHHGDVDLHTKTKTLT